jgi:alkanesulfonate monooxygenase SsuD/methylene tetrahydromethanopterin reductase-like flavin-dependent oxidoreductase (luciferase family)
VFHALYLPIFDALADPNLVARLSAEAEAAGWDGVFVWDHLRYRAPVVEVADPWITLAAMATATERLRLGPMVTPLPRRRPAKVARETATLDRLSGGRLTLGVGIAGDDSGELTATGEPLDDRVRAAQLDESLGILQAAWSGDTVRHRGEHYVVDGIQFLPRPVQRPIPVWVAVQYGNLRPLRRAARYQGVFPVKVKQPDQLAEIVTTIKQLRAEQADRAENAEQAQNAENAENAEQAQNAENAENVENAVTSSYDVAVGGPPGTDPTPYAAAGATWWMVIFDWRAISIDQIRGVIKDGPPAQA